MPGWPAGSSRGRMDSHQPNDRLRVCWGWASGTLAKRSYLARNSIARHGSASTRVASIWSVKDRLAGYAASGAHLSRITTPGSWSSIRSRATFLPSSRKWLACRPCCSDQRVIGSRAYQDLERCSHRTSAARTGKATYGRPCRSFSKSNKSSLLVQHPCIHLILNSLAARNRSSTDRQALGLITAITPQPRTIRYTPRRARVNR